MADTTVGVQVGVWQNLARSENPEVQEIARNTLAQFDINDGTQDSMAYGHAISTGEDIADPVANGMPEAAPATGADDADQPDNDPTNQGTKRGPTGASENPAVNNAAPAKEEEKMDAAKGNKDVDAKKPDTGNGTDNKDVDAKKPGTGNGTDSKDVDAKKPGTGNGTDSKDVDAKKPDTEKSKAKAPQKNHMAGMDDQWGWKERLLGAFDGDEDKANKWLESHNYTDKQLGGVVKDVNGEDALIYDSPLDRVLRKGASGDSEINKKLSDDDDKPVADVPYVDKEGASPSRLDKDGKALIANMDNMDDKWGWKPKLLARFDGDKAKANSWLAAQGFTQEKLDGLAKDADGKEALIYDSPLDKVLRKSNGTDGPVAGVPYVDKEGAASRTTDKDGKDTKLPDGFDEGERNKVSTSIKEKDPVLWKAINQAFYRNGRVDDIGRNNYLAAFVGDNSVSDMKMGWLKDRFTGKYANKPIVLNKEDFLSRTDVKDIGQYSYVATVLDKRTDSSTYPYIIDQLSVRFSDENGRKDDNRLRAMNDYINGRIHYDNYGVVNTVHKQFNYRRLEGEGARPIESLVDEMLRDPTVLERMPDGILSGDSDGSGDNSHAYNGGDYTENIRT